MPRPHPADLRRPAPAALTVIAVFNLIFGALALVCGCLAGGFYAQLLGADGSSPRGGSRAPGRDLLTFLNKEIPGYSTLEIGRIGLLFLLGGLLLAAGAGLLARRPWARWLSIGCAVTMIFLQIGNIFFQTTLVAPAVQEWLSSRGARTSASDQTATYLGMFGGAALFFLHAVALLAFMFDRRVAAALDGGASRRERDRPYPRPDREDEEDLPPRRRAGPGRARPVYVEDIEGEEPEVLKPLPAARPLDAERAAGLVPDEVPIARAVKAGPPHRQRPAGEAPGQGPGAAPPPVNPPGPSPAS